MKSFIIGLLTGLAMGSATVYYIYSITKGMDNKKRMKILTWIGIPAGVIMTLLAQWIGVALR